jgi:HK97 family phage portal protein
VLNPFTAIRNALKAAPGVKQLGLISNWLNQQPWLLDAKFLPLAKQAFSQNEVVYACLRLLSQSIPESPLKGYIEEKNGDKKEIAKDHELAQLIKRPNELMTEFEFWELTTLHIAIVGRSTWWKERGNNGKLIGLWPLRPDRVGPIYSTSDKPGERVLSGYSYHVPGTETTVVLNRADVLAFNLPDPSGESGGIVEGIGSIQAVANLIATDNAATRFVGSLLANQAAPTVVLKLSVPLRNEDTAKLIKAKFRNEFGAANQGGVAIIDGNTDIKELGFNLQQLEFPDIRAYFETRVAATLGTPAILVGLKAGLDRSTFSNMREAREFFAETTCASLWRRFQDQYTSDIASEFGGNIICEFDTSLVKALSDQNAKKIAPIQIAYEKLAATRNELREALGLEELEPEVGDVFVVASSGQEFPATNKLRDAKKKEDQELQEQQAQVSHERQLELQAAKPQIVQPNQPKQIEKPNEPVAKYAYKSIDSEIDWDSLIGGYIIDPNECTLSKDQQAIRIYIPAESDIIDTDNNIILPANSRFKVVGENELEYVKFNPNHDLAQLDIID